jgi:hypothetical protein
MVSEYSLNKILETIVELEVFKYENSDQSSANVDAIITEFEDSFGQFNNVTIIIEGAKNATAYRPNVKITKEGTQMEFFVEIRIVNPLNRKLDAAKIFAKTTATVEFKVDNDLKLYGEISGLKLNIIDFFPYY